MKFDLLPHEDCLAEASRVISSLRDANISARKNFCFELSCGLGRQGDNIFCGTRMTLWLARRSLQENQLQKDTNPGLVEPIQFNCLQRVM